MIAEEVNLCLNRKPQDEKNLAERKKRWQQRNALLEEKQKNRAGKRWCEKMRKFIPYEKLSKKQQREFNMQSRNVWTISPVTRRTKNSKIYNRKRMRRSDRINLF